MLSTVGPYELLAPIGSSATATVYRARQLGIAVTTLRRRMRRSGIRRQSRS